MTNQTVTSLIGNDYRKWNNEKNILLDCAMGRGKTHFIVNVLGAYAKLLNKQILYLCNRSKLSEEVYASLSKHSHITVKTYQSMQKAIETNDAILFANYIVCDEIHYIFTDSWNDKTDICYDWLMKNKHATKIFMSATGHNIFPCIKRWGEYIEYTLEPNYSYIKKIVFYEDDVYINRVIDDLADDEKLIYFSRKIDNAYNLHLEYEDSSFVCSSGNAQYKNKVTPDALVDGELTSKLTFATSVWDNGINIRDNQLKHIICDFEDLITLVQAIGRKRVGSIVNGEFVLSDVDNVTLHIKKWSKKQLTQFINPKQAILNEVDRFMWNDKEYIKGKNIQRSKRINECMYIDYTTSKIEVNHARVIGLEKELNSLKYAKKHGFDTHVLKGLGNTFTGKVEYVSLDDEYKKSTLDKFMIYLNSKVATRLFKDDQEELKGEFKNAGLSVDGGRTMGMKTMNAFMEDNNIPFKIESSRVKVNGKLHTIWTILQ